MRSDILKLRIIQELTNHFTQNEEKLTAYEFDMFWEILDQMSATRQLELWNLHKSNKQKESADTKVSNAFFRVDNNISHTQKGVNHG